MTRGIGGERRRRRQTKPPDPRSRARSHSGGPEPEHPSNNIPFHRSRSRRNRRLLESTRCYRRRISASVPAGGAAGVPRRSTNAFPQTPPIYLPPKKTRRNWEAREARQCKLHSAEMTEAVSGKDRHRGRRKRMDVFDSNTIAVQVNDIAIPRSPPMPTFPRLFPVGLRHPSSTRALTQPAFKATGRISTTRCCCNELGHTLGLKHPFFEAGRLLRGCAPCALRMQACAPRLARAFPRRNPETSAVDP